MYRKGLRRKTGRHCAVTTCIHHIRSFAHPLAHPHMFRIYSEFHKAQNCRDRNIAPGVPIFMSIGFTGQRGKRIDRANWSRPEKPARSWFFQTLKEREQIWRSDYYGPTSHAHGPADRYPRYHGDACTDVSTGLSARGNTTPAPAGARRGGHRSRGRRSRRRRRGGRSRSRSRRRGGGCGSRGRRIV